MKVVYLYKRDRVRGRLVRGAFDSSVIVEALKRKFPFLCRCGSAVHIADEYYYPVTRDVFDSIVKICKASNIPLPLGGEYKSVVWDCDDYSFYWKGLFQFLGYYRQVNYCFGVLWVYSPVKFYGHALNFFIDDRHEFMFFEPQTMEIFADRRDGWKLIELKV